MAGLELATISANSPTYSLASWLFLRLLGLIYLSAFASLATQVKGLIGSEGILPATELLSLRRGSKLRRICQLPTLCWYRATDNFLLFLTWGGAALSLLLVIGFAPMPVLVLLWVFYLSLFNVGRLFLGYQWDILLLETGFLAIFLTTTDLLPRFLPTFTPPAIVLWLLWWLLFRLMFSSGVAKLRSGDQTWRKLAALCHHYETQPLPTRVAWHAHQLSPLFHKISALVMFWIEVIVPFLILGPPPIRHVAALWFILLMVLIQLTGNYCFFNLLGIALSLLLLDDNFLLPAFQFLLRNPGLAIDPLRPPAFMNWMLLPLAALLVLLSLPLILRLLRLDFNWPRWFEVLFQRLDPFRLVNSYGLFSVMTTERPEIILEGSHDGVSWQEYEFKYKPGDVKCPPRFIAPHQPRLDWQMWFAALGYYHNNPWLECFMVRLLQASPAALSLFKSNPFPDAPPQFVRALLYDYRFTDRKERATTGAWWRRERRGLYSPVLQARIDSH